MGCSHESVKGEKGLATSKGQSAAHGQAVDPALCADAAALCACQSFRRASRFVTQLFDEALAASGLRSTQVIMLVSIAAAETTTPAGLARNLGMDASTANRTLATLQKAGLITKTREGRRTHVSLSAAGTRALTKALPLWRAAQDKFVSLVGSENWEDLRVQLDAVGAGRSP